MPGMLVVGLAPGPCCKPLGRHKYSCLPLAMLVEGRCG